MLKIPQYPKDFDGRPLDMLGAVMVDATGNNGAQFPQLIVGPDGAPIDKVGLVLLDKSGEVVRVGSADETIYAKDLGIVSDGVTINSAALVEAAVASIPGTSGIVIQFPRGYTLFDDKIDVTGRPIIFRGYGSTFDELKPGTVVGFPAGKTGFRIYPSAADSALENMSVRQTGYLTTSQLGSYTSGGTTITLNAAGDFQNGQVVQLDGAGFDLLVTSRLYNTTNGSAIVTWTDTDGIYRGNSPGYIGQAVAVAGAGFPVGTTILSWGIGTMTLSANATATVSNAQATLTLPIITEILSGGGTTTLTIADVPGVTHTVSNRKISHAAPGVYNSTKFHMTNTDVFDTQVGMCIHGITTGGNVADNGVFTNCHIGGGSTKFGVSFQGNDSQVNSFFGCNFAGPEVGVLDQSFLGNDFFGCHWAFNCGIMVACQAAYTKIIASYMESGTSYFAHSQGLAYISGGYSMIPGYGWFGTSMVSYEDFRSSTTRFMGAVTADGSPGLQYAGSFDGGLIAKGLRPAYFTGNTNNIPGGVGTLSGVVLGNSAGGTAGTNVLASVDNLNSFTMRELAVHASQFRFGNTYLGSQFGVWDTTKFDLGASVAFKMNGTTVVDSGRNGSFANLTASGTVSIPAGSITRANLVNTGAAAILGATGAGAVGDLTPTQVTALLNIFTTSLNGVAPASGGGTTNFLRADGSWAAPPGSGGVSDGDKGDIVVSGGAAFYTIDADVVSYAKMQNVSVTSRILGRATAGAGDVEELTGAQVQAMLPAQTKRISIGGLSPDTSGNAWWEPASIMLTNDRYGLIQVLRYKDTATKIKANGCFCIPKGYTGAAKIIVIWSTTGTSGNAVWAAETKAIANGSSVDPTTDTETASVTTAANGTANIRIESQISLTPGSYAVDDLVQFSVGRDGAGSDTIAADIIVWDVLFEFTGTV